MKKTLSSLRFALFALAATVTSLYPMGVAAAVASKLAELRNWMLQGTPISQATVNSNTLTGLIPSIFVALDNISRELVGFIPSVQRDPQVSRAAKGQQVTSFVTSQGVSYDITPGVTAPNDGDQVVNAIQLTVTKSKYYPIKWNGEEQLALSNGGGIGANRILVDQFTQGFRTLVNEMETDLALVAYRAASRAYGTPGTAPFGVAGDLSDFAQTAKILDDNGAPPDRTMVLGSAAMANLRGKQSVLFKVNEAGTSSLLRDGTIGRVEGFDLGYSAGLRTPVTKGTGAGYVTTGSYAVGATAITLATGTGTINPGDAVSFAGDPNVYVAGPSLVPFTGPGVLTLNAPGLVQAMAPGVAVTVGNSYQPTVAFSKDGLLIATRLPAAPVDASGRAGDMADDRTTVTDPFSGVSFEVALYRQYRQIKYEIGLAWGVAAPNPAHIAVLRG